MSYTRKFLCTGPVVNAYLTLATEAVTTDWAHADDGLPHTLEHLVFLGSELYPYKGVLDRLANRCLAEGTNAWTDVDHTAYTLSTAGCDGFLNLLPIYLDHVLYPTITDEGFITEVHHVQRDGDDAGVVYCEMQARENTADSLMHLALRRALFPDDGFSSETGGLMANLRNLTVEQVRRYHREYYRPDNLCIIVAGQVPLDRLLGALAPFEERIASKGPLSPLSRPWSTPVAPLPEGSPEVVDCSFPTDDEEAGHVVIGWRGPRWSHPLRYTELRILWLYLTQSAVAPLQQTFVECDTPYCASVDFNIEEGNVGLAYVSFEDVHTEMLDDVRSVFRDCVQAVVDDGVDMERIAMIVARERRRYLDALESRPHDLLAFSCIPAFLYGDEPEDGCLASPDTLRDHLDVLHRLDAVPTGASDREYWANLIVESVLSPHSVCIVGRPSAKLSEENVAAERARVAAQAASIGEEELERLAKVLHAAVEANEVPPPNELLDAVPVPSLSSVSPHPVITLTHSPAASSIPAPGFRASELASSSVLPRPTGAGSTSTGSGMASSAVLPRTTTDAAVAADGGRRASGDMSSSTSSSMSWQMIDEDPDTGDGGSPSSTGTVERGGWCTRLAVSVPSSGGASDAEGAAVRRSLVGDGLTPGALGVEAQWDHIRSSFVRATAVLDTRSVPDRLRPLCSLFFSSLFELPVQESSGEITPYEDVVNALMSESVSYGATIGYGGADFAPGTFSQLGVVSMKFEGTSYEAAARWLSMILFRTRFTTERIRAVALKLMTGASSTRRHGRHMASTLLRDTIFHPTRSNLAVSNVVRQQRFLRALQLRLETDPSAVCDELEEFRAYLTHPARIRLHVACNVVKSVAPVKPWLQFFSPVALSRASSPLAARLPASATMRHASVQFSQSLLRADACLGPEPASQSADKLIALGSVETSYLLQASRGPSRFDAEDTAPLMVALEYLTALEGDFWRKIRGQGLSYSYGINPKPEEATITFQLFKSTDLPGAYKAAKDIVHGYVSGATPLDPAALVAAKSTVVYTLVAREETVSAAASQSFRNALRGVMPGFNQALARRVLEVTLEEALHAMRRYLPPLFDAATSTMVICTGVTTKPEVLTGMAGLGRSLEDIDRVDAYFGEDGGADAAPVVAAAGEPSSWRPVAAAPAASAASGGGASRDEEGGFLDGIIDAACEGGWKTCAVVAGGVAVAAAIGWLWTQRKRKS